MNLERLRRIVALRRSRLQAAEQQVAQRRQQRDAARALVDASLARQAQLRQDIQARTAALEQRRGGGEERVATLLRLEEYIRAQRLAHAREQVVGGRAEAVLAQRRAELDAAALQLWRERHRLSHCEALVRRALQRRRLREELLFEAMAPARDGRPS